VFLFTGQFDVLGQSYCYGDSSGGSNLVNESCGLGYFYVHDVVIGAKLSSLGKYSDF